MARAHDGAETPETRERILAAAFKLLTRDGYARLSMRDIAAEAGVNHALIHYYFGTKDRLAIAALDEANRALIARQQAMYAAHGGFAEKWAQARAFYEQDLASGFVRVQMELWAASISNPDLRREFIPRLSQWRHVIQAAVRDALRVYYFELPISAEAIACWIVDFWLGMELETLLDMPECESHHREALDAMQMFLERLDREAGLAGGPSRGE